jgi:hypothetical protein
VGAASPQIMWRASVRLAITTGESSAYSLVMRLARDGWTRIGSPGIFG